MSEAPVSPADATARIAALEALLARANAALAARDLLIDSLRGQIARLRRMQFGASSEKLGREIEQLELALEELEAERDAAPVEARASEATARPAPVRSLPAHLPREEVVHEPASGACTCPDCGGALRRLGMDAHEMLDVVPVRWRVVRNIRPKYSCRVCEKIVQAPAPASAVARGKASFATLAHVVVSKFEHHLPLYRQAEMMAAQGLDIDRSTLVGWAGQAAALLDPVVARIRDAVLHADKIHADDTPVPVLDPGRGKTATGRLWVYAADDQASGSTAPRATWYRFTPDRTAAHPLAHLAGFRGFLQADAYAGYDGLYRGGATEVACWAHFRRKIFDLHDRTATPLTTDILERLGALYAVEAEVRGQPPDIRHRARQERSKPLVEALREVLDTALRRLSSKSDMAKAIAYGTKRWAALSRFLDDGRLEIDNNIAERALRGVAIGRRNWLFAGSRVGGERAAAIYTVIQTCKANGVDPQAYIADVIAKIASDWPASRWDELLPWNWNQPVDQPTAQAA
ncbi:IS66 family transposase [Sphingomonas sp. R1]|uniref:IS66 family transposase n=1 Tax=Sphingomonas sp. R1 TaxID=399176 RepID=UPI0039B537CC